MRQHTSTIEQYGDLYLPQLPAPHTSGPNYVKWEDDSWQLVLRVGMDGSAEIDPYWLESDGRWNHLFAPVQTTFVPHAVRAVLWFIAYPDEQTARKLHDGKHRGMHPAFWRAVSWRASARLCNIVEQAADRAAAQS